MDAITVTYSRLGGSNRIIDVASIDEAIKVAAELAGVTEATIRRRLTKCAPISSGAQVGGREIGEDGVWIESWPE